MDVLDFDGYNNVDSQLEPRIGMEFDTFDKAFSFYKNYAKHQGFGITKRSSRRSKENHEIIDGKFVCSRFGTKKEKSTVSNPRPSAKIDCNAAMSAKKRKDDGKWFIYLFIKEHNHELLKDESYYFPCHRKIKTPIKNNIRTLHSVGVGANKIYAAMSKQSGGPQNVGFLEKDIRNALDKERRLGLEAGDAQAMYEHLIHMQEENPNFFYALDLDEEQCLKNVLWIDAKGRHDYTNFGDVVSFDTTYITNRYKMPFAPFVGVNHHGQSVLLGCALIANETASTFTWLMSTWLRAMGGIAPKAIITDQDKAMRVAVERVFPDARHRYCLWHITSKLPEKLGHIIRHHENFMHKFNKCIYRSWTVEDFENRWQKMLAKFDLSEDEWLQSLYDDREKWVPTYMRDTFFAGMSTSQRSESINSFFDKYVSRKTTLREFVERYNVALQDRCEKESLADFQSWHTRPVLKSPSPYESQLSLVYTREIFKKFQDEVMGAHACYPTKDKQSGSHVIFKVTDLQENLDFTVDWDEIEQAITCLCHSFEFKGFLCRHAIIVLQISGVSKIPDRYILKRWTKEARSGLKVNKRFNGVQTRVDRYNDICRRALELAEEGSKSEEAYKLAKCILEQGVKQCVDHFYEHNPIDNSLKTDKVKEIPKIFDPSVVKTKGAPKRILKGIEKSKAKKCRNTQCAKVIRKSQQKVDAVGDKVDFNLQENFSTTRQTQSSLEINNIPESTQTSLFEMEPTGSSGLMSQSYYNFTQLIQSQELSSSRSTPRRLWH